ncbi:MAG: gluconokinase [Chitinophagaceae bacterium]
MICVVGVDIGTGSTKAVAVNEQGSVIASAQRSYATAHTAAGYSEQQPTEIWKAFVDCLGELSASLPVPPHVVTLSSAMHSLLCVNREGELLTPLMIWSDSRSALIAEALQASPEGEAFYRSTGTPIHAMTPLCKIRWLAENKTDVFEQTSRFLSIKEWIWWKLFGCYEIDYSMASATGMFAVAAPAWHLPALAWAGVSEAQLSKPVATEFSRKGLAEDTAAVLLLSPDTSFIIGASDGCLANLGTDALEAGTAAITIGSSGAVRLCSKKPILRFPSMPFSYRLYDQLYICGGPINNGGIVLLWALKIFMRIESPGAADFEKFFDTISTVKAGCEGLVFLPYLTGERAPVWDAKSCGVFFGLGIQHSAAHMMRAAVEGVCYAIRETIQMVEESNVPLQLLKVSGGFARSAYWLQMIADVTRKNLCTVQTEDASAIGAAYMALHSLGLRSSDAGHGPIIQPQESLAAEYDKGFSVYQQLYAALKKPMHHLHHLNY